MFEKCPQAIHVLRHGQTQKRKKKKEETHFPSFSFRLNAKHLGNRPTSVSFAGFLKTNVHVLRVGRYVIVFVLMGITAVSLRNGLVFMVLF
jgi:hypothetical protein